MKLTFKCAAAAVPLLLFGCAIAPEFAEPPVSAASATVSFVKGFSGSSVLEAPSQGYLIGNGQCDLRLGAAFTAFSPAPRPTRVLAVQRLFVEANAQFILGRISRTCHNAGSFVPEAGHAYHVTQVLGEAGCRLQVLDDATGAGPPSIWPDTSASCKSGVAPLPPPVIVPRPPMVAPPSRPAGGRDI
jgi:hypothetical protein